MADSDVRNVYKEIPTRLVIRTPDVYQMQNENGVDGYSDELLSVVANFSNSGVPEGMNARGMAGKSKRGEVACQIFGVIDPKELRITAAGFRSRGCIAMTGCASRICTMITGLTIEEALSITPKMLADSLGGVPSDKNDTPVFACEAVRAMIGDYLLETGGLRLLEERDLCDESGLHCIMCEHCSLRDLRIDAIVDERIKGGQA